MYYKQYNYLDYIKTFKNDNENKYDYLRGQGNNYQQCSYKTYHQYSRNLTLT